MKNKIIDCKKVCDVEDCNNLVYRRGHCTRHHLRMLRTGSTDLKPRENKKCMMERCNNEHLANGYCVSHYHKMRRKKIQENSGIILTDIIGQKFGMLLVKERTQERRGRDAIYACECECGTIKNIARPDLLSGATKSCGCLRKKIMSEKMRKWVE